MQRRFHRSIFLRMISSTFSRENGSENGSENGNENGSIVPYACASIVQLLRKEEEVNTIKILDTVNSPQDGHLWDRH